MFVARPGESTVDGVIEGGTAIDESAFQSIRLLVTEVSAATINRTDL